MYRHRRDEWPKYFARHQPANSCHASRRDGAWKEGHVGPVYTTAINATILQLDNGFLPIYQR